MTLKLAALALAVSVALCPVALAEDEKPMLTEEFLAKCDSDHALCVKFVTDVQIQEMLMYTLAPRILKLKYCMPRGISDEESTVAVVDWVKSRKDYYSGYPAAKAVQNAGIQLWPCKR